MADDGRGGAQRRRPRFQQPSTGRGQRVDAPCRPGSTDVPLRRDESFSLQSPQQPVEVAEVHLGAIADQGGDVLQQVVAVAWAFVQQQQQRRFDEPFDPSSHRPLAGA